MHNIEIHPFQPYSSKGATTLIVGSFPCFNGMNYGDWFYSSSGKNDFWSLLSEVFNSTADSLEQKQHLCSKNGISITDIAYKVERTKGNCSDSNLRIVEYNMEGLQTCLTGSIKKILCTGKFVEKHFKKLFPDINILTQTLLSPSPAVNRYIAGLPDFKTQVIKKEISSIYNYKLENYKTLLLRT